MQGLSLIVVASLVEEHRPLGHSGFRSSSTQAHVLSCPMACGILVPRLGIDPVSPALTDGSLY